MIATTLALALAPFYDIAEIGRLLAVVAGLLAGLVVIPLLIAQQHGRSIGQTVYEDAPKSHAAKQGTPTMGGIAFIIAALIGFAIAGFARSALPLTALMVAAGMVGLADDLLIVRARRALGLRARVKFSLIGLIAIGYVAWVYGTGISGPVQTWFVTTIALPVGLWFALAVLAVVGAANAVNLSDGVDGLAAGAAVPTLVALQLTAHFLGLPGGSAVADAVLGAILAFLWFNRHPARIFMGDTGSLALGALLAGVAIESHAVLLLPLFGAVFVVEALSVIAQVASFKTTGRRILRMSPLHHHFELSGWRESAVSSSFVAFATITAAATWITWWTSSVRAPRLQ